MAQEESPGTPERTRRRHITFTPEEDRRLKELADEYHAGNRSAFVRAAVNRHGQHLDNGSLQDYKRLCSRLDDIEDTIEDLREELVEDSQSTSAPALGSSQCRDSDIEDAQREVHRLLIDRENQTLSMAEIVDEVSHGPSDTGEAIRELLDANRISREDAGDELRYQIQPP